MLPFETVLLSMADQNSTTAPKSIHPPAEAIAVVGSLLIMFGVGSLLEIPFSGFKVLNAGFLAIPIGYGILKGSSGCRATVLVLLGFALVAAAVFVVLFALRDLAGWQIDRLQGPETWVESLILCGILGATVYMFLTLRRADVRRLFYTDEPPVANARSFLISVTLVTTLMLSMAYGMAWKVDQFVEDLYHFRVEVDVRDAVTGKRIDHISTHFPPSTGDPGDTIPENFQETSSTSIPDEEGNLTIVSGMATQPLVFKFGADGYETKAVTIDENSDDTIHLELQPLAERQAEEVKSEQND